MRFKRWLRWATVTVRMEAIANLGEEAAEADNHRMLHIQLFQIRSKESASLDWKRKEEMEVICSDSCFSCHIFLLDIRNTEI